MKLLVGLTFLVICVSVLRAEEPLAAGRIVALSGLPGDVESDRAYQRSLALLQRVVDLAEVDRSAVKMLVHKPGTAVPAEGWPNGEFLTGSRENFLALARELEESDDPVTVVVWGHGGMIRGESVLHVAGPRISEADFLEFGRTAAAGGAEVRWVLFFPGSGKVASSLAAAGQAALASEAETRFESDPVGLDIVLEEWRAKPEATLEELAQRAGPRIVGWYEARSRARTEEPALFDAGGGAPVVFTAEGMEMIPLGPGGATEGDGWQSIGRADPADYPSADAVVLERSLRYTLGENPAISAEIEETIQILTAEGKRHGDFSVEFSPPQEDLEFSALEVIDLDGEVEVFDPKDVLEAKEDSAEGYGTSGSKMFSLRGVEPGALLRVKYRRTWRRFPFPHVFLELPIQDDIPVRRLTISVEAGKSEAMHARVASDVPGLGVESTERETSYGRRLKWTWDDVPAAGAEVLAPPGGAATLQVSTFPDWESFAAWYLRLIELADTVTDEIRAKAAELTVGIDSEEGKVRALYEFVARLRYVSVPLGVNSYRPHAAANVLANRYGDCKDKANLLNALCRAEGIEAKLVLVPRFSEANEAVPGLAFNHAISRIELPGGPMWLDSTDDVCPFGMLPPGDPGREVLVIEPGVTGLERLPEPDEEAHRLEIDWNWEGLTGDLKLRASGFAGYEMRVAARAVAAYGGTLSLLQASDLAPMAGTLRTEAGAGSPPGEIENDFVWSAKVERIGAGGALPFSLPREWSLVLQPRSRAVLLNDGYPLILVQTVRGVERGENRTSGPGGPLEWELTWGANGDGRLEVRLRKAEFGGEELEAFRRALRELYAAIAGSTSEF